MKIKDKVFEIYPANVSAEQIAHTKYVSALTPEGLSAAAMKDIDPDFPIKIANGKILVAGPNFGCNSSREWAPAALLYAGIKLVIAEGYARIFFRNAINIGLPILECKNITSLVKVGDELEADLSSGEIVNLTTGATAKGTVLPQFLLDIMTAGGLLAVLQQERRNENETR